MHNKALHLTAIPLHSFLAPLHSGRCALTLSTYCQKIVFILELSSSRMGCLGIYSECGDVGDFTT